MCTLRKIKTGWAVTTYAFYVSLHIYYGYRLCAACGGNMNLLLTSPPTFNVYITVHNYRDEIAIMVRGILLHFGIKNYGRSTGYHFWDIYIKSDQHLSLTSHSKLPAVRHDASIPTIITSHTCIDPYTWQFVSKYIRISSTISNFLWKLSLACQAGRLHSS